MHTLQIHNAKIQLYDADGQLCNTFANGVEYAEFNSEQNMILCKFISGKLAVLNPDGFTVDNIANSVSSARIVDNRIKITYISGKEQVVPFPNYQDFIDSCKYMLFRSKQAHKRFDIEDPNHKKYIEELIAKLFEDEENKSSLYRF